MPMFGMGASMTDEERRRLAAMQQSGGMPEQPISYTPEAQRAMDNAPRLQEGQKRQSFWQGGDKFTVRDGIAGALAAVGDGFSNWANGGGGQGVEMLAGGRIDALKVAREAKAKADEAAKRQAAGERQGISPDQMLLLGDNVGSVIANRMKPEELDAFDRDMSRAGIMKGTPEYNQMAQQRAQRTAQGQPPIVTGAPIPGGTGTYTGYMDDYLNTYGSQPQRAAPGPQPQGGGMPRVNTPQDYDALAPGEQYTDPSGKVRTKGGAGGNASGSF